MITLEDLEAKLSSLVEIHLVKYVPGYKPEDKIPHLLAAAMHESLVSRGDHIKIANIYTIIAHPITLKHWNSEPALLGEMANALITIGKEAGFYFSSRPKVTIATDDTLKPGEIRVLASFSTEPLTETRGIPAVEEQDNFENDPAPANAFLILAGTKNFQLDRPVINIGRRLDNHIVISDPRVSRSHAQIRAVKGRFVLFDLESTGGTHVNGQRISQVVLFPGDVISLAGVTLIFGQDLPTGRLSEDLTEPGPSPSFERPATFLNTDIDK